MGQRRLTLAVLGPSLPWSFGPYAFQAAQVAQTLAEKGIADELVWISMLSGLDNHTYTEDQLERVEMKNPDLPNPLAHLGNHGVTVTYRGTGAAKCGQGLYTSTINAMLAEHGAGALISLMDHQRVWVDAPLSVRSLVWFPDHFTQIDMHHRHVFGAYSNVVALSPSSAAKARKLLPHKHVSWIPHVVEPPAERMDSRAELRARLGLRDDIFLVFLIFANYDPTNRKSVDLAVLAFRSLLDVAPDAHLIVHAVSSRYIFSNPKLASSMPGINIEHLIHLLGVPLSSVKINDRPLPHHRVLEMMRACDVLLHPSKAEGFGLPVLEAQLLGVPVITTRFGAMGDYTHYGTAVPPRQLLYLGMGLAATPDLDGVVRALREAYHGRVEGNASVAQEYIQTHLAADVVAAKFETLLTTGLVRPPYRRLTYEAVRAAADVEALVGPVAQPGASSFGGGIRRFGVIKPASTETETEWVLLVAKGSRNTVDEDAISHCMRAPEARAGSEANSSLTEDEEDEDEDEDMVVQFAVDVDGEEAPVIGLPPAAKAAGRGFVDGEGTDRGCAGADGVTIFGLVELTGVELPLGIAAAGRPPVLLRASRLLELAGTGRGNGKSAVRQLDQMVAAVAASQQQQQLPPSSFWAAPDRPPPASEGASAVVGAVRPRPEGGC